MRKWDKSILTTAVFSFLHIFSTTRSRYNISKILKISNSSTKISTLPHKKEKRKKEKKKRKNYNHNLQYFFLCPPYFRTLFISSKTRAIKIAYSYYLNGAEFKK